MIILDILHISNPVQIPAKGYGGTEKVVYSLAYQQAKNGHNVTVIAGRPSIIPNVKDNSFVYGQTYCEGKFIIKRNLTSYSLKAMLKSRESKFDIVHNHISEEAIFLSILSKNPIVTTLHCPITLLKFAPLTATTLSGVLPRKTKFIAISKRSYKAYRPFYRRALLTFVHNGLDVSNIKFSPFTTKENEITIGFLGKLIREKYPHLAIKIADVIHKNGYGVKLFVMGKLDFPLSSYAQELIKMAKKRSYVTLVPNAATGEVQNILGNCDVLLNTSYEIGLIMAQIEAMAMGTPVVGPINGSAEEVVEEGHTGYLGSDLNDVARKCVMALDLSREACRKFVENHFSETNMYKKYMNAYNLILSGKNGN